MLQPLLWYLILGVVFYILWNQTNLFFSIVGRLSAITLFILQVHHLFNVSHNNQESITQKPSYAEFFSKDLFNDIDTFIDRKKSEYRVVSIGLHPSIAAFNGFFTLDGYSANYPLEYKKKFREIIAGELVHSEAYRNYFDNWGSRYYIFVSELETFHGNALLMTKKVVKKYSARIKDLKFNVRKFSSMGGEYVFSALEVENAEKIGLNILKKFNHKYSSWEIFLYQVSKDNKYKQLTMGDS
ncbi:hypothetical protein H0A36_16560 [Endozoicomonas sp. SM1973]|uniref:Uncharacterized protein n=2 Tax=Spartinivicinus marinus TaxID=2994442 RepID=A0A853IJ06_9GAMM|nr:hypothetical protein [Spartinivicinus marinus]